jgi:hypothetical protein
MLPEATAEGGDNRKSRIENKNVIRAGGNNSKWVSANGMWGSALLYYEGLLVFMFS